MGKELIYPIIIKFKTKEVMIGSIKVEFDGGEIINRTQREHNFKVKEIKLQFKEGDYLTKLLSAW